MHRLGMNLSEIVGSPDNEDLQYAAQTIRRYFGAALAMAPMLQFMANVPGFLLPAGSRAAHRTHAQELAQQLRRMAIPPAEHPNRAPTLQHSFLLTDEFMDLLEHCQPAAGHIGLDVET